ncbi:MAG: peptidylprolyl isomerase [Gammaproteobacteria bacterium]
MRILAIAGAVLLGALLIFVGAFGARWLLPEQGAGEPVAVTPAAREPAALNLQTLRELLAVLDPAKRAQILDSSENFKSFVDQETTNQAVLAAAYANGAEANESIRVLMERAGQRVLAAAYLNQVVRLNLAPDFPTEEQVREAYDKNPQLFRVPRRMHLWQIYLPLDENADEKTRAETWKLAEKIAADLKSGKASFEAMAKAYSAHQPSRVNDGYMGVIKVTELLPPIAAAAEELPENGVSEPVASASGLHIIRRGAVIDEEQLEFDAVRAGIRQRLVREAALKVRQAAIEKIAEEFPVERPQGDLESWRESLRAAQPGADAGEGA